MKNQASYAGRWDIPRENEVVRVCHLKSREGIVKKDEVVKREREEEK